MLYVFVHNPTLVRLNTNMNHSAHSKTQTNIIFEPKKKSERTDGKTLTGKSIFPVAYMCISHDIHVYDVHI